MRTRPLLLSLGIALLGCSSHKEPNPSSGSSSKPPSDGGQVVLSVVYGSEKKTWLEEQIAGVPGGQHPKTPSGKADPRRAPSRWARARRRTAILDGSSSRTSSARRRASYVTLLNQAWLSQRPAHQAARAGRRAARAVADRDRDVEADGRGARLAGQATRLERPPQGVDAIRRAGARSAIPSGARSSSATPTPSSRTRACSPCSPRRTPARSKTRGLDARRPRRADDARRSSRRSRDAIVHYGKSTGFFADKMLERGPAYLSAAVLVREPRHRVVRQAAGAVPARRDLPGRGHVLVGSPVRDPRRRLGRRRRARRPPSVPRVPQGEAGAGARARARLPPGRPVDRDRRAASTRRTASIRSSRRRCSRCPTADALARAARAVARAQEVRRRHPRVRQVGQHARAAARRGQGRRQGVPRRARRSRRGDAHASSTTRCTQPVGARAARRQARDAARAAHRRRVRRRRHRALRRDRRRLRRGHARAREAEPGRIHAVVVMTDGKDENSQLDARRARRSSFNPRTRRSRSSPSRYGEQRRRRRCCEQIAEAAHGASAKGSVETIVAGLSRTWRVLLMRASDATSRSSPGSSKVIAQGGVDLGPASASAGAAAVARGRRSARGRSLALGGAAYVALVGVGPRQPRLLEEGAGERRARRRRSSADPSALTDPSTRAAVAQILARPRRARRACSTRRPPDVPGATSPATLASLGELERHAARLVARGERSSRKYLAAVDEARCAPRSPALDAKRAAGARDAEARAQLRGRAAARAGAARSARRASRPRKDRVDAQLASHRRRRSEALPTQDRAHARARRAGDGRAVGRRERRARRA